MTPDPASTVQLSDRHRSPIGAGSRNPAETSIRHRTTVRKRSFYGLLAVALFAGQVMAATYTVTNLNDLGTGSLRAAILAANANSGGTVVFNTNGTINLSTPLPAITSQMIIDGTTATGFSGTPLVSVNFNSIPGITVAAGADGSKIKSM